MGAIRWGYGFRHYPWRTRLAFNLGFGTTTGRFRADIDYDFPLAGAVRARIQAYGSGVERNRFYGFGNETTEDQERAFYHADRSEIGATALLLIRPASGLDIGAGPVVRIARHDDTEGSLLDSIAPYGTGAFDAVGAMARITLDRRNRRVAASNGALLEIEARAFPAILDVASAWGALRGEAATYLSAPIVTSPTLALRLGGEKIWGDVPYFEAASIGGSQTVRGFARQRFLGHAAAFANAELRVGLSDFFLFLPGTFGVFGLADSGRVFARGEDSDRWHSAAGGGIWLSFLSPANTLSIAVAQSSERTGVYLRAGFVF
jgi:hypothetical protein